VSDGMTDAYSEMNTVQASTDDFEGFTIEIKSHTKKDDGNIYETRHRYEITKSLLEKHTHIDMTFCDILNHLNHLVEKYEVKYV
jgi:hypothetical protein